MKTEGDKRGRTRKISALTNRQRHFVELVIGGASHADAYRKAYHKENLLAEDAAEHAWRVANRPAVKAELARLRGLSNRKALLSINDRLGILADIAQDASSLKSDRIRSIDVYNRTAGDQAPQRLEVTGKDGAAIPVATTAVVMRVGVRDRMAAMRAARQLAESQPLTPTAPPPP